MCGISIISMCLETYVCNTFAGMTWSFLPHLVSYRIPHLKIQGLCTFARDAWALNSNTLLFYPISFLASKHWSFWDSDLQEERILKSPHRLCAQARNHRNLRTPGSFWLKKPMAWGLPQSSCCVTRAPKSSLSQANNQVFHSKYRSQASQILDTWCSCRCFFGSPSFLHKPYPGRAMTDSKQVDKVCMFKYL